MKTRNVMGKKRKNLLAIGETKIKQRNTTEQKETYQKNLKIKVK